ncbi:MAG: DoxX family protein [Phycisphaerales bacterium]
MALSKAARVVSWFFQIVMAVILVQTLFFKFTGSPESVYIFTKVGMEPWGRYGSGVTELIASILLLIPHRAAYGALLAVFVMVGAIGSHLTKLGIVVRDDGGLLFGMALTVFISGLIVLAIRRRSLPILSKT